jgi:hypothetical protein
MGGSVVVVGVSSVVVVLTAGGIVVDVGICAVVELVTAGD